MPTRQERADGRQFLAQVARVQAIAAMEAALTADLAFEEGQLKLLDSSARTAACVAQEARRQLLHGLQADRNATQAQVHAAMALAETKWQPAKRAQEPTEPQNMIALLLEMRQEVCACSTA